MARFTRFSREHRTLSGFLALLLLGGLLMLSPAGAHINDSVSHVWSHIREKADQRYVQRMWAVVKFVPAGPHPEIARGHLASGVDAISQGDPGNLDDAIVVTFKKNVRNCAYEVTPGSAGSDYEPSNLDTDFFVSRYSGSSKAVYVRGAVNNTDDGGLEPFHLAVIC